MIKAVLFDYGGVMTNGGRGSEVTERLAANLGVTFARAKELLAVAWLPFINGKIAEDELWKQLEVAHGAAIPPKQRNIWNTWQVMRQIPEMVSFVARLKAQGLRVGLLSNVFLTTLTQIRTNGGYDGFDFMVLSAEVGYSKPQPEIYQLALDKLPGIQPAEIIFVDDQERCLEPARVLGIHTVLATSTQQIIEETTKLIESHADET